MDVLICEDDPLVQSLIGDLVVERGGQVLAVVETEIDALSFLDRFAPDVLVVDLALTHGNGANVIAHARRRHPSLHVIVFTGNDSLADLGNFSVDVVLKPDFERLDRLIASAGERTDAHTHERRRPVRDVSPASDAQAFYRLVADARPDDVLLCVTVEVDGDEVTAALRDALRGHDQVLQRSDSVVALLIGGGDETVRALEARLRAMLPGLAGRSTSTVVGTDPIDAFSRLTAR
jgi:CheY-like chemotaxis protein